MKFILCIILLFPLSLFAQSSLPQSYQATFIENSGPDEVMVRAKGIGGKSGFFGLEEEESVKLAVEDARKSAVYFVLFGGEGLDGILKTENQKNKFSMIKQKFFVSENIQKFITWEENGFDSRIKLAGGKKILVEKEFRINRKAIINYLVAHNIIESAQSVTEQIGYPTLMVIPEVPPGKSPLDELQSNPLLKQAETVIEAFLTSNKYDVVEPEQAKQLYNQEKAQLSLHGHEEDLSYAIALSVGSDIYLTYNIIVNKRYVGSTIVRKASASIRAFETTTARLLGAETGYSEESAAPPAALIEAAITNAMNNVLSRIYSYWQDDISIGLQYKIIFNLTGEFTEDQIYNIQNAIEKTLKKLSNRTKENIVTNKTVDYSVWIHNSILQSPSDIFRAIRREFNNNFPQGQLEQIILNRKLIIANIK